MIKGYTAYKLTNSGRDAVLAKIKTQYEDVICDHITVLFAVDGLAMPADAVLQIYAVASSENVQTVLVAVDGEVKRADGKFYHLTLSVDRENGGSPGKSKDVIKNFQWTIFPPVVISAMPVFIPFPVTPKKIKLNIDTDKQ